MSTGGKNKGRRRGDDVYNVMQNHQFFEMGTIVIHRDGVFLWASARAQQMLGGNIEGLPISDFISEEYYGLMEITLKRVIETGEPGPESEIKYISRTGASVFAQVRTYRIIWQGSPALLTSGNDETRAWNVTAILHKYLSHRLSSRAYDFLTLRAKGEEYGDIAQIWGVDRAAVKNYPSKIMKRLKINRAEYDEILELLKFYFFYENK